MNSFSEIITSIDSIKVIGDVIVALVSSLVGALVGAIFTELRENKHQRLYAYHSQIGVDPVLTDFIVKIRKDKEGTQQNKQYAYLGILRLVVWNAGKRTIKNSEISDGITIMPPENKIMILDCWEETKDSSIIAAEDKRSSKINFKSGLNKRQCYYFEILFYSDEKVNEKKWGVNTNFQGEGDSSFISLSDYDDSVPDSVFSKHKRSINALKNMCFIWFFLAIFNIPVIPQALLNIYQQTTGNESIRGLQLLTSGTALLILWLLPYFYRILQKLKIPSKGRKHFAKQLYRLP